MVIVRMIGQSAALLPNLVMIENGRRSETERGLVFEEGLIIQRKLKIQSKPLGKLSGAIWLRIMSGIQKACAKQLAAFQVICSLERKNSVKQIYSNVIYNQLVSA